MSVKNNIIKLHTCIYIISIDGGKSFWQSSTNICDESSSESRLRGNLPQHNKNHIWQTSCVVGRGCLLWQVIIYDSYMISFINLSFCISEDNSLCFFLHLFTSYQAEAMTTSLSHCLFKNNWIVKSWMAEIVLLTLSGANGSLQCKDQAGLLKHIIKCP